MSVGKDGIRGFTLVELMVSVSIFAFMTAFLLAKYGTFNRGIFLTNLAYDIALTIRSAQSYGLNVQGVDGAPEPFKFRSGFGVHFETESPDFFLYADYNGSNVYDSGDGEPLSEYSIKRNNKIVELTYGANCDQPTEVLDITFLRPNPDAIIIVNGASLSAPQQCARIVIEAPDKTRNTIEIRSTGQIAVKGQ
jgi:prepilin-type N-terminal cleavage/methylation domain-containing protein